MGQAYENFAADLLSACQLPKQLAALPIAFEKPVYGSNEPTFTEFMAPGKDFFILFRLNFVSKF